MYKSIIFDIGGVMVDFDPKAYLVDRLCSAEMEEKVYDLTFGSEEWKKLDAGLISRFDGNATMLKNAQAAGCEFEVQGVLDDWTHILRPRHRMIELVRRLKNHGYCVYYLSNIPEDILELLTARGVLDQFDGGVASCEVKLPVAWMPNSPNTNSPTKLPRTPMRMLRLNEVSVPMKRPAT